MSIEEADTNIYFGGAGPTVVFALSVLACLYFVSTKILSSASLVAKDYTRKKAVDDKYKALFLSRDGLLYHISRAKARGEDDQVAKMLLDLDSLDKRIDALEENNKDLFKKGYFLESSGPEKEKLKV